MEDTSSLKEIAKYGVAASGAAALLNPIAGGVGLVASGGLYIAAGVIDRQNRRDNQKDT